MLFWQSITSHSFVWKRAPAVQRCDFRKCLSIKHIWCWTFITPLWYVYLVVYSIIPQFFLTFRHLLSKFLCWSMWFYVHSNFSYLQWSCQSCWLMWILRRRLWFACSRSYLNFWSIRFVYFLIFMTSAGLILLEILVDKEWWWDHFVFLLYPVRSWSFWTLLQVLSSTWFLGS